MAEGGLDGFVDLQLRLQQFCSNTVTPSRLEFISVLSRLDLVKEAKELHAKMPSTSTSITV